MRISERKRAKGSSGNYGRIFDSPELGAVISRVHSTAIASGHELEERLAGLLMSIGGGTSGGALDDFIQKFPDVSNGVYLARKGQVKKSSLLAGQKHEPDMLIFIRKIGLGGRTEAWIIELKVGHAFDTKKVSGELDALNTSLAIAGQRIAAKTKGAICCFFEESRDTIRAGLKGLVSDDQFLTGRELCALLGLGDEVYEKILADTRADGLANRQWLRREVVAATDNDEDGPSDRLF